MAFGQKVGSIKDLKQSLKKGTGTFIKYIPKEKDGTITVRFLDEPDEWVQYREVFDQVRRKSYPVPDEGMPGYPSPDARVSDRYLVNALDTENDKIIPLQLPKDLANQLVIRYEKYDTICDRDYELGRVGEGLDTVYYCNPDPPAARKMSKYTALDLEKTLEDAYGNVFGSDGAKPRGGAKTSVTAGAAAKRRRPVQVVEEPEEDELDLDEAGRAADEDDDADAQELLTQMSDENGIDPNEYETWAEVATAISEAMEGESDDETEAEPEADESEEQDDDEAVEYTEEDLLSKTIGELRTIARDDFSVATKGLNKTQIVAAIMATGDEEPF